MFLFPLNVGFRPCFHCTVLIPVYRVYTSCVHNTVVSSCYRLRTSCLHHAVLLLVSVWTCGINLFLRCVISQELMKECRHAVKLMVSMLYVFIWSDLAPTSSWEKLHPVPLAMLIVTMISGHIQYLRHTVSIDNRFPWLYINCFQSPWSWLQCIIIESGIFPWWVSRGGVACF